MSAATLALAPTSTVSLPDWIDTARVHLSKKDYLECAVVVALELTRHLIHVVDTDANDPDGCFDASCSCSSIGYISFSSMDKNRWNSSSLLVIQIEDILLKNVIVTVESARGHAHESPPLAKFRASNVKIQLSGTTGSKINDIFDIPQLSQQDSCFALGKILFELFAEGDSSLFAEFESHKNGISMYDLQIRDQNPVPKDLDRTLSLTTAAHNGSMGLDNEQDDGFDDVKPPTLKRASLSSTDQTASPTKSMRVFEYLQARKLPFSICRLVSDLLDAEEGNSYIPDTALLVLKEVEHDLTLMESYQERFLYDSICPRQALDKTCLSSHIEGKLYGRENELGALMDMIERISLVDPLLETTESVCEAAFLGGHSGSGKSSIIKKIVSHWNWRCWSMVFCKFDRQISPLSTLILAFDTFFGKFIQKRVDGILLPREPHVQGTFDRILSSIMTSIDSESFSQLCELLPRLAQLFPVTVNYIRQKNIANGSVFQQDNSLASFIDGTSQTANASSAGSVPSEGSVGSGRPSSGGNVGSGRHRLLYSFHILFKIILGAGHPVLICKNIILFCFAETVWMPLLRTLSISLVLSRY